MLCRPGIVTHHENVDGQLMHESGVDVFDPALEPAQFDRMNLNGSVGSEVDDAGPAGGGRRVRTEMALRSHE